LGGAKPIVYKDAMYSTTYKAITEEARTILGSPIEARDEVDNDYFIRKTQDVHTEVLNSLKVKKSKLQRFMQILRNDQRIRKTLGDKTG